MSPLDSAFLRLEDRHTSLHIASIAVFDGPAPTPREIAAVFESKLILLPRFRQRIRELPLHLGQPVWVDDPTFCLDYHLRRTATPPPGSMSELRDLVGRLMSQQLDRSKPLWESWTVDGLEHGRWAMINKVHHCMVDGIAGTDLLGILLDRSPGSPSGTRQEWQPDVLKGPVRLLSDTLSSAPRRAFGTCRNFASRWRRPRSATSALAVAARGILGVAGTLRVGPPSSLSGPLGASRMWTDASLNLDEVTTIKQAMGGTVNDVVLAAVTRGFRDLLVQRGEELSNRGITTLVPVSVRTKASNGRTDNQISAMLVALPIQLADPLERFAAVRAELDRLKRSGEAQAGQLLTRAAHLIPPIVASFGLTVGFRLPQRVVLTVATNVPGPRGTLFLAGRRLRELYPYVPIADHVRIAVAITSYESRLYIGVTADRDSSSDVAVMTAGIEDEIHQLRRAASGGT